MTVFDDKIRTRDSFRVKRTPCTSARAPRPPEQIPDYVGVWKVVNVQVFLYSMH